jgi:hypothetical protein
MLANGKNGITSKPRRYLELLLKPREKQPSPLTNPEIQF